MPVVFDNVRFRSISMAVAVAGILHTLFSIVAEAAAPPPPTPTARRLIDTSGFISIDCGLATGSYYLEGTNLYYTSDDNYITTGKRVAITSSADPGADSRFKTVRSFPEGKRNCYTLFPVNPNQKYLIRAWFLYDNYDGASSVPGFDLYVAVDFWETVTIQSAGDKFGTEIIYVSSEESIEACLVNTGHGTPFISALDLRPLDNAAYAASSDVSLRMFNRWDAGPTAYDRDDRLYNRTDDVYDRVWFYSKSPFWEQISTNKSIKSPTNNTFKVPTGVLATAAQQINGAANFSITHQVKDPTANLYVYWHFAEIQLLAPNQTREFYILVPHGPAGYKFGPVNPSYLTLNTIQSTQISLNGSTTFTYALKKTDNSALLPIINAAEVYVAMDRLLSPTNKLDVDAVTSIKKEYNISRIWQGDPCLPITYKWDTVVCVYNDNNPPRITGLDLSSSNLTGELPSSLSNLTLLHSFKNLSHNGFTGKIPEFLGRLPELKVIDLSRNNLIGPVPPQLAEKARNKSIVLRLAGNPEVCKSFPCEKEDVVMKQKRHSFIILLIASIALTLLIVVGALLLVAFRNREKQVDQAIKSRNKQFTYSEIVKITNNFKKILGKGAFGSVYYGLLHDGTQVAVKILNNNTCPITIKQFCAEAELLMKIHHINLVSLIGYCDERSKMALVCEYMSNGNLQTRLSVKNELPLSWKTRLDILIDTAQGLEYLHSGCQPQIIHRDVKPANILLDDAGHAKISDFGLSRHFTTYSQVVAMTDLAGTPGYCDPEYVQMNILSEKSDVYSFGVVLMELITGQPALVRCNTSKSDECVHIVDWVKVEAERGDITKIVDERIQGEINANSAWKLLEIGMECVKLRGEERPRMSEVVAELKLCYASEQIDLADDGDNDDYHEYEISGYPDSSVDLNRSSDSLLPSAR